VSKQNDLYFGRFFAPEYRPKINMSLTCVRHDGRLAKCSSIFGRKKVVFMIFMDAILGTKNNKTVWSIIIDKYARFMYSSESGL
jgi:hypothetical protein